MYRLRCLFSRNRLLRFLVVEVLEVLEVLEEEEEEEVGVRRRLRDLGRVRVIMRGWGVDLGLLLGLVLRHSNNPSNLHSNNKPNYNSNNKEEVEVEVGRTLLSHPPHLHLHPPQ